MHAHAVNGDFTLVWAFNHHAHIAERLECGKTVLPFEEPADTGNAVGQRAKHDGAVGNGLVARYPQASGEGACGGLSAVNQ